PPGTDLGGGLRERRQGGVVLEDLPVRFEDDRERTELLGHRQEPGGAPALQPQGSAGAWASAGEEQRPACRFPEASREQRRIGQVVDQELLDLLRFEDEVGGVGGLVGGGN